MLLQLTGYLEQQRVRLAEAVHRFLRQAKSLGTEEIPHPVLRPDPQVQPAWHRPRVTVHQVGDSLPQFIEGMDVSLAVQANAGRPSRYAAANSARTEL